jgi:hypothetical protein
MTLARAFRLLIPFLLVTAAVVVYAEGPLYVGGPPSAAGGLVTGTPVPGLPFHWPIDPTTQRATLTYWTDQGSLGTLPKSGTNGADDLVQQAFQAWAGVSTASISFIKAGDLGGNVTATGASNAADVINAVSDCSTLPGDPAGGIAKPRTIIYDDTLGSIIIAFGDDPITTLGFADAVCLQGDGTTNFFNRGYAVLNGKGITSTNASAELLPVMTHEFGHLLGLDHSQINLDCLTNSSCGAMAGVPLMFPFLMTPPQTTPRTDDIAGISELYPGATFASSTGTITGHVFFSDGVTPAEGYNVIARQLGNPQTKAVSNVSGYLFTSDAGNPFVQVPGTTPSPFGSHDPSLIGSYRLPGLPPWTYTVEVEALNGSGTDAFVFGSGVGPIGGFLGFQFPLPSLLPTPPPCAQEYLVSGATATCNRTGATPIPVSGGQVVSTGTDIILIGTPPPSDAWED